MLFFVVIEIIMIVLKFSNGANAIPAHRRLDNLCDLLQIMSISCYSFVFMETKRISILIHIYT